MRKPVKCRRMLYLPVAFVAVWLYGAGAAWAGDGGESLTGLNNLITGLCSLLNITTPCPQFPTITQAVLEIAGLETSPPEMVRALNSVDPGTYVDAGNAAAKPPTPFPLDSKTSPALSNLLSTLTPLAFDSGWKSGPATATQLYDSNADTFLYAVASGSTVATTGLTIPDALNFFYDNSALTIWNLPQDQVIAKFSLPLTVLNNDGMTETPVSATLQFKLPRSGKPPCSASKVVSSLWPQGIGPDQIGVNCAAVFGPSPISKKPHAIFEVQVPLLVTMATDPPYFYFAQTGMTGPINFGIPSAFFDDTGFTPTKPNIVPAGASIGIAPSAAPLGPPPTCTGTGCTPPPSTFALCASLPRNGFGPRLVPSVGAYYAIATDGETLLSAPLPGSRPVCVHSEWH